MIKPHLYLTITRPDEVAECWEKIDNNLYLRLWEFRRLPDFLEVNSVADFWHLLQPWEQEALNSAAEHEQAVTKSYFS